MYSGRVTTLVILMAIGCLMQGESGVAVNCDSLDDCTLTCPYGKAYDENECQICECLEPCKNVSCASDETCEVQEVVCKKAPCKPQGVCVQKPATVECEKLEDCTLECEYGRAYDEKECEICECLEPCKSVSCASDEVCEVRQVQCIRAPCPPQGLCVKTQAPYDCDNLEGCTLECQYGKAYDQNECQICECLEPCKNMPCASDEVCTVMEVECFRSPCPPVGACVLPEGPSDCEKLEGCTLECQYGLNYDDKKCEICECFEPCKDVICSSNETCEVQEVRCIRAPCPQLGVCVQKQDPSGCDKLEGCTLKCDYGLSYDDKECEICECFEPCKDVICSSHEQCVVREVQCIRAPCPQSGVCVEIQDGSTSTQRARDLCLLEPVTGTCKAHMPRWFFNVSALECQQFVYGGCEGNDNNFETIETCLGRCLPSSLSTRSQPEEPCIGPCQIQMNDKGGTICACPGTDCTTMLCKSDEECRMMDGLCMMDYEDFDADRPCYSVPKCFTKSNNATTEPTCPFIDCELMLCEHGFNVDERGCKICSCYDPCQTYECLAGQKCVARPADCTDAEGCRDGPLRECIVETPSNITRYIPGPGELLECCQAYGMSDKCQTLCTTDFKVSSSNLRIVLGCIDEMNIYRHCAGGEYSYRSCCLGKGVATSCSELCSDNTTRDSSYMQRLTTCVLSETVNDALTCLQTGAADVRQTVTPTPASEASRSTQVLPTICRSSPVEGPCKAQIERWFYNTTTRMCEKFYYGGCNGNQNNFMTMNDCVTICKPQEPTCPEIMCGAGCSMAPGSDGCHTCVCDSQCPIIRCSRECQYGIQKDSKGCDSCDCVDPCMDMECTSGQMCTYKQYPVCNDDVCKISYRGQCTAIGAECPTLNCTNSCSYGRVKNGKCETCDCATPCKDVPCATGYACKIISALTCLGETCEMKHGGMCFVECPSLAWCDLSCEFGYVKDNNDCNTCECFDPCKNVTCKEGQVCVKKTIATYVGENHEVKEVFVGQCQEPCARMECGSTYCHYGYMKDINGCEICQCFEPCQNVSCSVGMQCEAVQQEPTKDHPYSFVGLCTSTGCPNVMCSVDCPYGLIKDENGCNTCKCYDPCLNFTCSNSISICQPKKVNASETQQYEYVGECISCTGMVCRIACDYGVLMLTQNCPLCECFDPCKKMQCANPWTCVVRGVLEEAEGSLQSYIGECVGPAVMYCTAEMNQNEILYADRPQDMPQLNCDSHGYYKPMQCNPSGRCNCTSPDGQKGFIGYSMNDAIELCFPDDKIIGRLRILDEVNITMPGIGASFKREISNQLATTLLIDDSKVTVTEYSHGGSIVDFVVSDVNSVNMEIAEHILESLANAENPMRITFNGKVYAARIEYASRTYSTTTSPSSSTVPPSKRSGLSRAGFLVLVILLPIVGALVIGSLLLIYIYKVCRSTASFEPMSNRSSMSFDSTMEKAVPPKTGYDNPNYDSAKVYPISANFYQGSTKA